MMGILRLIIAAGAGATAMYWLPKAGVLAATQELIAFLALLMAGLLPAMTLTATMLRGGGMSARRIREYGGALEQQMRFWAFLFAAAGVATLGISFAKIFSAQGVGISIQVKSWSVSEQTLTTASIMIAGAGLGVVFQRLIPAYAGLKSLLHLNIQMAEREAINHGRTLLSELSDDAAKSALAKPYETKS